MRRSRPSYKQRTTNHNAPQTLFGMEATDMEPFRELCKKTRSSNRPAAPFAVDPRPFWYNANSHWSRRMRRTPWLRGPNDKLPRTGTKDRQGTTALVATTKTCSRPLRFLPISIGQQHPALAVTTASHTEKHLNLLQQDGGDPLSRTPPCFHASHQRPPWTVAWPTPRSTNGPKHLALFTCTGSTTQGTHARGNRQPA